MLPVSLDCFCFVCLRLVYPIIPVYLDRFFLFSSSCVPHDKDKQSKNNPEKLATRGTQDEDKQHKNNPEKLER
jgi:hypothetical protein